MDEKYEELWESKKSNLLTSIDVVLDKDGTNKDVLELMKDMLNNTKVVNTMEEYYNKKEI